MNKGKMSPRPWRLGVSGYTIISNDCPTSIVAQAQSKRDARFIFNRIEHYDNLLSALKDVQRTLVHVTTKFSNLEVDRAVFKRIQAAIEDGEKY